MTYYKVVARCPSLEGNHDTLLSVIVSRKSQRLATEYLEGKWVKPKFGALMVFDNWTAARNFALDWNGEVWECEIRHYKNKFLLREFMASDFVNWFKAKLSRKTAPFLRSQDVPQGTVFASAVKLLKKVG